MNDTAAVAAHALNLNPHVHGNGSAPHRRGGGWRRYLASAAAGLAIVASGAGIADCAAVAEQEDSTPSLQLFRDRPTGSFAGYIKTAKLGKLKGSLIS
jgi:hypothetical protein